MCVKGKREWVCVCLHVCKCVFAPAWEGMCMCVCVSVCLTETEGEGCEGRAMSRLCKGYVCVCVSLCV